MAKVVGASKVTVRYQVTIPVEVRRLLKIKEGQTLVFAEDNSRVFITTELHLVRRCSQRPWVFSRTGG